MHAEHIPAPDRGAGPSRLSKAEIQAVLAVLGDDESNDDITNARSGLRRMLEHEQPLPLIGRDRALADEFGKQLRVHLHRSYSVTALRSDSRGTHFEIEHRHPEDSEHTIRVMRVTTETVLTGDRRSAPFSRNEKTDA